MLRNNHQKITKYDRQTGNFIERSLTENSRVLKEAPQLMCSEIPTKNPFSRLNPSIDLIKQFTQRKILFLVFFSRNPLINDSTISGFC